MQRSKIELAKETLKLLQKKSFNSIRISDFKIVKKNNDIKDKNDLIININRYFDFLLNTNLSSIEKSSIKDMIFEVYMARLDILNLYRPSIKNIIKYISSQPQSFIKLAPSFIESIISMASICNLNINGIKGIPKIKGMFILYLMIIYTWNKDETPSLETTMTSLDKYLSNIDKFFNIK